VTFLGISSGHIVQRQFSLGGCLSKLFHSYYDKDFCFIYLSGVGVGWEVAGKKWEKKIMLREMNLATVFGI